jgi:D-alanyl-lipoteichoic acid acyltransferase DltB (MBOAT superfamily)
VYIPLGGSRKGEVRKYINLLLTFLVSGIWHGNGFRFIAWGLLHAVYQILGDLLRPVNRAIKRILGIGKDTSLDIWIDRVVTFTLVMFAWIIFRANTLTDGLEMIKSIFTVRNTWVLFDDSLLALGLDWKEIMLMIISIQILFMTEARQEKMVIRDRIMKEPLLGRWILYLAAIAVIIIFGTYGYGFDSSDFIYRGF